MTYGQGRLALLGAVLEHAVGAHVGLAHHDVEAILFKGS